MSRSESGAAAAPLYPAFRAKLDELVATVSEDKERAAAVTAAKAFVDEFSDDVDKALRPFSSQGHLLLGEAPPASAYNDFYKWTMLPVMKVMHRAYPEGLTCTFSANIRDADYRRALTDSATGRAPADLIESLRKELECLASRTFDRELFEQAAEELNLPGFDRETLDSICGPVGNPRTLAQKVVSDLSLKQPVLPDDPNSVQLQLFLAPDAKIEDAERVYIEATGPWQLVTWLETSMMQTIYDVLFRDSMRKRYKTDDADWYPTWLAEAFVRCALSMDAARKSGLRGALFTGRRTGGLPLMFLQSMYMQSALKNEHGASLLIGTSSVTAYYWLRNQHVAPSLIPKPAGTHAHELSMMLASVLGDVDDKAGLPLSQIIGHTLYFFASLPRGDVRDAARKNLMPMLPDTLGTDAFMKTAIQLNIPRGPHKNSPFLSVIGAARQDSGEMKDFAALMKDYVFTGALMASEIETQENLFEAKELGYALFGAGGFFGDSEKAWNQDSKNISMAIKLLRVYVGGTRTRVSPAKTGDGEGKFEADGMLSDNDLQTLKDQVKRLQQGGSAVSSSELQDLYSYEVERLLGP